MERNILKTLYFEEDLGHILLSIYNLSTIEIIWKKKNI